MWSDWEAIFSIVICKQRFACLRFAVFKSHRVIFCNGCDRRTIIPLFTEVYRRSETYLNMNCNYSRFSLSMLLQKLSHSKAMFICFPRLSIWTLPFPFLFPSPSTSLLSFQRGRHLKGASGEEAGEGQSSPPPLFSSPTSPLLTHFGRRGSSSFPCLSPVRQR